MTSIESDLRLVTEPMFKRLHRRTGMVALQELPTPLLQQALRNFDEVITAYNLLPTDTAHSLKFIPKVREAHPTLPTTADLITKGSTKTCVAFRQSIRTMNSLMLRAEQGEPEPKLAFAMWQQDGVTDSDRLLGGITHMYGLTLAHYGRDLKPIHPEDYSTFYNDKDIMLDALLEVAAIEHGVEQADSPLYELGIKMGWYEARLESGEHLFTDDIRSLAAH